ncbi:alkanal monooxygenase [Listeria weihenstephanensis FSL R9-0317]|uniref:LLM class flavin-dependent oxidoreductase n=1 Tax=Listeria weihenstephanensis TaxID=1006155 RepID=A0A1S7FSH7_9LIST|nr:LLM class flavin-dependent oxidoreductase [Listeria weihenstephanensis]AQY50327.1 luciferase [Listeria weihenstephanensis]EUJ40956.1 alkanal monooxygenase [Listeria weihenstephanensis FSL R9-0317]MBC1501222.1 LLM class flavin-dependent oxidoreductase [Listeria weihenstephanensis]
MTKNKFGQVPLSILDLATIREGFNEADAFENSKNLIQFAEKTGFHRYWVAEHHGIAGVASSATAVLIGYLAGHTKTIRVGSGGVMLPNHSPLIIAEQFGTLETMYPNRIDLGLGRAPGTDFKTARALRRDLHETVEAFPNSVVELSKYFSDGGNNGIIAIPGRGLHVPLYLLGSSTYSAKLAAKLGLPFAFASHFAPDELGNALELYRSRFEPSDVLAEPYAMATVNTIIADTDEEANLLATSGYLSFLNLTRGAPTPLPKPVTNMDDIWSDYEKNALKHQMKYSFIGDQQKVTADLKEFMDVNAPDELIVASNIYDPLLRQKSYQALADVWF